MFDDRDDRFVDPELVEALEKAGADRTPYSEDPWVKKRKNLWGTKKTFGLNPVPSNLDWVWVRVAIPRDWNLFLHTNPIGSAAEPFWQVEFGADSGAVIYNLFNGVHTIFGNSVTVRTINILPAIAPGRTFIAFCGPANVSPSWTGTFVR